MTYAIPELVLVGAANRLVLGAQTGAMCWALLDNPAPSPNLPSREHSEW
jgi:hypothetical protein